VTEKLKQDLEIWRASLKGLSNYALQNEPASKDDLNRVLEMIQALVDAHGALGKAGTPHPQQAEANASAPVARAKKR